MTTNLEELKRAAEAAREPYDLDVMLSSLRREAARYEDVGAIAKDAILSYAADHLKRFPRSTILSLLAENDRLRSELEAERERRESAVAESGKQKDRLFRQIDFTGELQRLLWALSRGKPLPGTIKGTHAYEVASRAASVFGLLKEACNFVSDQRDELFQGHQVNGELRVEDEVDQNAADAISAMDDWLLRAGKMLNGEASPPLTVPARSSSLPDALDEIEAYFDNRADADQPAGSTPIPNEEMRLLVELRAARAHFQSEPDKSRRPRTWGEWERTQQEKERGA